MSFYKEIFPFLEYIHSIRKLETYLSYDMVFPTKWVIPKVLIDENKIVAFEAQNTNMKGISFVCKINEKEISDTLFKIAKVIKVNQEKEMKEKLFKETIEKLKTTFEKNDLEKLKNLYFDFETDHDPDLEIDETDVPETEDAELA